MPALDQINQGGTIYEIVPEIAELFKTTKAYHTGDHVIYEAGWYTFKADKSAGAWDATKVDGPFKVTDQISELKEDLTQKANIDGSYENMKVGLAENLDPTVFIENTAAYTFRTTGGNADVGDFEKMSAVVGGSLVWNQLCNGSSVTIASGHKYLLKKSNAWSIGASAESAITGLTSGSDMVIDLTQMFGSTIADYTYSLEQANAGAGVAFFRKLFPNDYYPYDAGALKSVGGVSSHDMVGFNQWDEEWEVYGASQIRSKNKIPVLPELTYYAKTPSVGISLYFKAQINDTANVGSVSVTNNTFTVPTNAHYVVMYANTGYGTVYKNDICINLSWDGSRDGEYEPYDKRSYPLDSSLTLRGIPKLNSANSLYYDGDIYESDGTVKRRYGIVDLGTLSWAYSASPNEGFYCDNIGAKTPQTTAYKFVGICPIYEIRSYNEVFAKTYDKSIAVRTNGGVRVYDSAYTDATAFKAAMSGVYLVYELATPTTEEADPYTETQWCSDFGTERFVPAESLTRDVEIPVGHVTKYPPDLKAKLEMTPNSPPSNGLWLVKHENGENTYVQYLGELPADPSEDGSYYLKATRASGTTTLSWEAQE